MIVDLSTPTVPRTDDPAAQLASASSRTSGTDAVIVELRDALAKQVAINAQLEHLNTIRSRFISIVTHEFRTALTGIQGFSEMIRDEDLSVAETKDFANDINEDAKRLNRMITDMLDMDRIESGRMVLQRDQVDLNALIVEEAGEVGRTALRHTIELQLDAALPPIFAARDKLRRVLTGLLSNAVKYSPTGGQITIQSHCDGPFGHVTMIVRGMDIPAEELAKSFERYSRIEAQTTRSVNGVGLGLSYERQIVQLHEGRLWAESTPGQGATFHFTVPMAAASSLE